MASKADEQNLNPPVSEESDYEQLIDDYTHFAPPHDGELLQGRVVKLHDKDVIVDFGYKSEGLVPIEQFALPDGTIHVQVGDQIDVMVDRQGIQPEGYILLSHQKASRLRSWENLEKAHARRPGGLRPRNRPHQRRTGGGCRGSRLHARLADRYAPHPQSRFLARPGHPGQNRQAESPPRQRGGVSQDGGGRRAALPQERGAAGARRRRGGYRRW